MTTAERMKLAEALAELLPNAPPDHEFSLALSSAQIDTIVGYLRTPEAADAGVIASHEIDEVLPSMQAHQKREADAGAVGRPPHCPRCGRSNAENVAFAVAPHGWLCSSRWHDVPTVGGYPAPSAAGIAAPPAGQAKRWYICYDGYGMHYKSSEPKGHVALCFDEDFADQIVEMLERAARPAAVVAKNATTETGADAGMRERAALEQVWCGEVVAALRWLRAFWKPGSNHDTNEVQLALAASDAALEKADTALSPDAGLGMAGSNL